MWSNVFISFPRGLLLLAVAALVPGCAHHPEFTTSNVATLRIGVTTVDEARALFGPPDQAIVETEGQASSTGSWQALVWNYRMGLADPNSQIDPGTPLIPALVGVGREEAVNQLTFQADRNPPILNNYEIPIIYPDRQLRPPPTGTSTVQGPAQVMPPSVPPATALSPAELYRQCSPSVVQVFSADGAGQGVFVGSGFVVAGNRVITAAHVIHAVSKNSLRVADSTGHLLPGARVLVDFDEGPRDGPDLAVIQLDAINLPALALADSTTVKIGQRVFVIGSPEGLTNTLSDGLISNILPDDDALPSVPTLQITAPISHGSSGGPVILEDGQVAGVADAFLQDGQNINFAVPIDAIIDVLDAMSSLEPSGDGRGLKTLRGRADAGNIRAMYELAFMYESGCGLPRDWSQAISWYRRAADEGDAAAMAAVGDLIYRTFKADGTAEGTPDGAQAMPWFRKAAAAGDGFAMAMLGEMYLFGNGVEKDQAGAVVWLQKGADNGSSHAMLMLGTCYEAGWGVPQDRDTAHQWQQRAADRGNRAAQWEIMAENQRGGG
jgi:S1-C subfamily serine protease